MKKSLTDYKAPRTEAVELDSDVLFCQSYGDLCDPGQDLGLGDGDYDYGSF